MTAAGDRPQTLLTSVEQAKLQAIYDSPFYKRLVEARCGVARAPRHASWNEDDNR